jgi:hypothetical protein
MQRIGVCNPTHVVAAALAILLAGPAAADDIDLMRTGPYDGFIPPAKTFQDVKSEPLEDSQSFSTTWAIYSIVPVFNTAGFLFSLDYDGHEMSSLTVTPRPGLWMPDGTVTLPGSESGMRTARLSLWVPMAQSSGTWLPGSTLISLFHLAGHAKNTTPCNNSDIDITLDMWRIHHFALAGPHIVGASTMLYLTSPSLSATWATVPGQGYWVHNTTAGFTCAPQSAFVATNFFIENVAGFGIEHVPEPLSVLMMLAGTGALLTGRVRRHTRR